MPCQRFIVAAARSTAERMLDDQAFMSLCQGSSG
jgi:hypothetical protein